MRQPMLFSRRSRDPLGRKDGSIAGAYPEPPP